ncbi:MAG: SDR family NAD(P)-dependent oxidoreductase [Acidimicrobiaceae bacterium]|nr:SDR family NAD(P)-dependent oxidoreductase [Acidimicrobiaceae bacterium]
MINPASVVVDKFLECTVLGSFSRVGYATRSRLESWIDPPSMASQRVVITGATSGLGFEAAARLAALGASVTFVARDESRARSTVNALQSRSQNERIEYILGDTSDLADMRRVAQCVTARGTLDVLIHNAGAITAARTLSPQGFEVTLAAQLLGPFHLTRLLLPVLTGAKPGRVLTVSSGGLYSQHFDLATLEMSSDNYDGVAAYAKVKRAQLVLNHEWVHHVSPRDVVFHAMHPGWADTPGLAASLPKFYSLARPWLRTPAQGADTLVWLAGARETSRTTGDFWLDRHPRFEHKVPWTRTRDPERDQAELWDWCVERTEQY